MFPGIPTGYAPGTPFFYPVVFLPLVLPACGDGVIRVPARVFWVPMRRLPVSFGYLCDARWCHSGTGWPENGVFWVPTGVIQVPIRTFGGI